MVRKARQQESWERAAEELVRQTRLVLESRDAIEEALAGLGEGGPWARAQVEQLERFCQALELELWRVAVEPRKTVVMRLAGLIKVGSAAVALSFATDVGTGLYDLTLGVEEQATTVERECAVVQVEEASASGTGELQGGGLEAHAHGTFEPAPSPAAADATDEPPDADHEDIASEEAEQLALRPSSHYVVGSDGELIPTREHLVGDNGELIERELTDQVGAEDSGPADVTPGDGPDRSQV